MNVLKKLCDYISDQADTEELIKRFEAGLDDEEREQLRSFKTVYNMIKDHDTIYNLKFQTTTTTNAIKQAATIRLTYKEPNKNGVIDNPQSRLSRD